MVIKASAHSLAVKADMNVASGCPNFASLALHNNSSYTAMLRLISKAEIYFKLPIATSSWQFVFFFVLGYCDSGRGLLSSDLHLCVCLW